MTPETFNFALRTFVARRPFEPFTIELVDGSRLQVERPDDLAFRSNVAVFFARNGSFSLFDHESVVRIETILEIAPDLPAFIATSPEPT